MIFYLPVFICAAIGFAAGLVCHRIWRPFWKATFAATLAGTLIWTLGVYVLLFVIAANELGQLLLGALLHTAPLNFVFTF